MAEPPRNPPNPPPPAPAAVKATGKGAPWGETRDYVRPKKPGGESQDLAVERPPMHNNDKKVGEFWF